MDPKALESILKLCVRYGVAELRQGDLYLTLDPGSPSASRPRRTRTKGIPKAGLEVTEGDDAEPISAAHPDWDSLTDEEKLFWSSAPKAGE